MTDPSTLGNWIDWQGGICPVPAGTKVEYLVRSGAIACNSAEHLDWHWDVAGAAEDIVAYWVLDNPLHAQVGGDHYKSLPIQPVEYIHRNKIGYFEGNVIKYVTRWRSKNGIADLEKAKHYIDLLIQLESASK